jgi:drug/metabolite transporter (DMT)-like permease
MIPESSFWILFTVVASLGQVLRNAMQTSLIKTVGIAGATHVRFLYGFPFALAFLAIVHASVPTSAPPLSLAFFGFVAAAASAQVIGTGLMLEAMKHRSFVVTTAYLKTEPTQVAISGALVLGDRLSAVAWAAIFIATAGVVLTARKGGGESALAWRPAALGLISASFFAVAAVGYRGAIQSLPTDHFVLAATTALAAALGLQAAGLSFYLWVADRRALVALMRCWKPSLLAGLTGAASSQFWFLAFALETAAMVRTLALIEVLFAGVISGALLKQAIRANEALGIALIVFGVGLLLAMG